MLVIYIEYAKMKRTWRYNRMKMKKLAGIVLAATMLVACSKTEKPAETKTEKMPEATKAEETKAEATEAKSNGEKVKVRMAYWNKEESVSEFLKLAKEKLPNIEIDYNFISVDQLKGAIETQLQAGEGPDILPSGDSPEHARAGYLMDLTDQPFMKNFSKAFKDSISYEGKVYGVPGPTWFEGIFYNKEIFEKNNIQVPKTFAEMMEVHKKLKDAGIVAQAWGNKSWEPLAKSPLGLAIVDYLQTDAGREFDTQIREGKAKFSGSKLEEIVKAWAEQYIKGGYITQEMLQIDYDTALKQFAEGKAAMWESGPWSVKAIQETNPNLKFDMMPFVGTKEGNEHLIGGSGVAFGVNANSKNKEAALKVVELLASKEGQEALCASQPGSGSFLEGADIKLPEQFMGVKEVLNKGNVYCPWFVWKADYNEVLGKGLQEVIQGNGTVEDVMKQMDQKVEEIMAQKK